MLTETWAKVAESAVQSSLAANRAALAPFLRDATQERQPSSVDALAFDQPDWEFDRSVADPDAITVGDTVTFAKTLAEADVRAFARASGDTNRLHLDDEYADATRFGGRIVHGTLVAGLISAALARLPGLTVYLSQDLEFASPVRLGDRVRGVVEVTEVLGGDQYRLTTTIETAAGEPVVDGEAVVLIDAAPDP